MVNNSWITEWNDIVLNVFYKDEQLKSLMKLPEGTKVMKFIDQYFIRAGYTTKVLTNETVRIVYGTKSIGGVNNPHVTLNEMSFDIYVKLEDIHMEDSPLSMRTHLIAQRIINLLTKSRYLGGYRFWVEGESEMGTSTIGYARYNVTFGYMRTY